MKIRFEWDEEKSKANFKKHGIRFEEAQSVFRDPQCYEYYDLWHSHSEDRHMCIGHSENLSLLIVVYSESSAQTYRIISARRVTPKERKLYEEGI